MKSQLIHHHVPTMQVLHPVTSMHSVTYRWATTGHPEKKSGKWTMHRLPCLRDRWERKHHSPACFHCLLVYSHSTLRHRPTWMSSLGIWRRRWSLGITSMDLPRLNHAWPMWLPSVIKWQDLWMRGHHCYPLPWFWQDSTMSPTASLDLAWSKLQSR